jgi:hypothetical protein
MRIQETNSKCLISKPASVPSLEPKVFWGLLHSWNKYSFFLTDALEKDALL